MKRVLTLAAIVASIILTPSFMSAQSLTDLLKGLGSQNQSSAAADSSSTGSSLGGLINGVAGALGLGNSNAGIEQLAGTWSYSGPAVSFKSDNFLLKAGGAAAATTVEKKIEPYYKAAGLTSLQLTINTDSTFVFKVRNASLNGTVSRDDQNDAYVFHFKALKKISIGSMEAYIKLTGSNMELTFDITKLMTLVQRISAISGNSTLKGASALLEQYDGMTAGFDLKKSVQ